MSSIKNTQNELRRRVKYGTEKAIGPQLGPWMPVMTAWSIANPVQTSANIIPEAVGLRPVEIPLWIR